MGISPSSVGRIWAEAGLKPHLTKGFKVSNDPLFEEKCAFHGRRAVIPRDRGHSFHGIAGSHSTAWRAVGLTDGFMESGLC